MSRIRDDSRIDIRESSMRHLQNLYSTTVGIGLSVGLLRLLQIWTEDTISVQSRLTNSLLFGAMLITLVPFYHGGLVHLDVTYIKKDSAGHGKNGAHLFAFVILFLESCLLVTSAFLSCYQKITPFAVMLAILLVVDVLWALATHLWLGTANDKQKIGLRWALINFVSLMVVTPMLFVTNHYAVPDLWFASGLLAGSLIRTCCDYKFCWEFYYPPDKETDKQRESARQPRIEKPGVAA